MFSVVNQKRVASIGVEMDLYLSLTNQAINFDLLIHVLYIIIKKKKKEIERKMELL